MHVFNGYLTYLKVWKWKSTKRLCVSTLVYLQLLRKVIERNFFSYSFVSLHRQEDRIQNTDRIQTERIPSYLDVSPIACPALEAARAGDRLKGHVAVEEVLTENRVPGRTFATSCFPNQQEPKYFSC